MEGSVALKYFGFILSVALIASICAILLVKKMVSSGYAKNIPDVNDAAFLDDPNNPIIDIQSHSSGLGWEDESGLGKAVQFDCLYFNLGSDDPSTWTAKRFIIDGIEYSRDDLAKIINSPEYTIDTSIGVQLNLMETSPEFEEALLELIKSHFKESGQ